MSKIFVNVGLSLDGYMAPEGMTMERSGANTMGKRMFEQGEVDELEIVMAPVMVESWS